MNGLNQSVYRGKENTGCLILRENAIIQNKPTIVRPN